MKTNVWVPLAPYGQSRILFLFVFLSPRLFLKGGEIHYLSIGEEGNAIINGLALTEIYGQLRSAECDEKPSSIPTAWILFSSVPTPA